MRKYLPRLLLLLCLPFFGISTLNAQGFIEKITDFFEFDLSKPNEDTTRFIPRVVVAPVATYEPSTSLGLGLGAKLLFKPKRSGLETRTSNLPLSLTYTLRNQFIFFSGYTVFFHEEQYLLKGNLEWSKFPQTYYGLGNLSAESQKFDISSNKFLIQPLLLKQIFPAFFVGGGIRYQSITQTRLLEDYNELPEGTSLQQELGSTSLGLELAITFDNRDNVLNAQYGNFLEFTHGFYDKDLGSTHSFMLTKFDFRQYLPIAGRPKDALAFQWYTRLSWGDTPPLELSSIGGAELLRGFQEGRFRDKVAFFAQSEYRWQTFDRLGLVFFAGAGKVAPGIGELDLKNLKYSLGSGLRLKIVPSENLNIRFDYAFGLGRRRENNFYLGIAEAF